MLCLWKTMKINLKKTHIPLPNKWIINNQSQYETAQFLMEQEQVGIKPSFFITFHYYHPDEVKKQILTSKFGEFQKSNQLWKENPKEKFIRKRRLNEDDLEDDTKQIKNVILKELYGIKRLNQTWKYDFPNLLFFHELGKSKVKFHTHLLLTSTEYFSSGAWRNNPSISLEDVFNNRIRKKRKCFSNWKKIHVKKVFDVRGALSYLNKETNSYNYSIDYTNSNTIKTNEN